MIETVGRYEILAEIGQGGFAVVYRAHDTELGRVVALKELRRPLLSNSDQTGLPAPGPETGQHPARLQTRPAADRFRPGQADGRRRQLLNYLRNKKMLLLLDNF